MTDQNSPAPENPWRFEGAGVVLVGCRCRGCGKTFFPRAAFCDVCDGDGFETVDIGRQGVLYSFSEIHVAPRAFATPYVVGYVDFSPEVRVFGQIDGTAADLAVDDRVEAVIGPVRTEADGRVVEGYRFRREGARHA